MILQLVCLLGVLQAIAAQSCPAGFTYDNGTMACYLVSNTHANFDDAQQNCVQFGANLAVVHSSAVQAMVTNMAHANDPDYLYYIGLRRTGQNWMWVDGSQGNYTAWLPGQPVGGVTKSCVSTFTSGKPTGWRVGGCSDVLPYVCMYTAPPTTMAPVGPHTCYPPNYMGPSGTIFSPGYQMQQHYGNSLNCHYQITVASGMFVRLTINHFQTEGCCDFFKAYSGTSTSGAQLASWSGTQTAGVMVESAGNQLYATFTSDSSVNFPGFSISYMQTNMTIPTVPGPHCNPSNYSGATGAITSPNYPGNYYNNQHCVYYIGPVAANMGIALTFDVFNTESNYDFVAVYDGTSAGAAMLQRYTGNQGQGQTVTSHMNTMKVLFTSDSSNVAQGFHATWATVVPPTTPPPPTLFPSTLPSTQCGADYFFDPTSNACYHYDYRMLTWADANSACTNQTGGAMLSIHNAQVEGFISSYVQNATMNLNRFYTWIGLMANHGQFTGWSDGTRVDYTQWEAGNPNITIGQCVAFQAWSYQGKPNGWRSFPCNVHRPFVCKKARIDGGGK